MELEEMLSLFDHGKNEFMFDKNGNLTSCGEMALDELRELLSFLNQQGVIKFDEDKLDRLISCPSY